MKVRFAVALGGGYPDVDVLASAASSAEALGFDTLYFADLPSLPALDPVLAVAVLTEATERMRLGMNLVPFGVSPFRLARQLAQLDVLTKGRLLLTLVPGLDLPGERAALGIAGQHRGQLMDQIVPALRDLWAGRPDPDGNVLAVRPQQDPLEVWLAGSGPDAIERAGRLSDGWLGSMVAPARASSIRDQIADAAVRHGREIDPEHYGLSIGYAQVVEDLEQAPKIPRRTPRPEDRADRRELIPVGRAELRSIIGRLVEGGLSKFVLRPLAAPQGWDPELQWLAESVLDLQT